MKLILTTLIALATLSYSAEDKKPSFAEEAYNKSVEANSKDVYKTYDVYLKALEDANKKIVKDLEKIKVDLNDVKKFTKLTISDRASAITEIDGKIAELKKGALGDKVVAWRLNDGDLLGGGGDDMSSYVGRYVDESGNMWGEVNPNNKAKHTINNWNGVWTYSKGKLSIAWSDTKFVDTLILDKDGKTYIGVNDRGASWKLYKAP